MSPERREKRRFPSSFYMHFKSDLEAIHNNPDHLSHDYVNTSYGLGLLLLTFKTTHDPSLTPRIKTLLKEVLSYDDYWKAKIGSYNQTAGKRSKVDPAEALSEFVFDSPKVQRLNEIAQELRMLGEEDSPVENILKPAVRLIAESKKILYGARGELAQRKFLGEFGFSQDI